MSGSGSGTGTASVFMVVLSGRAFDAGQPLSMACPGRLLWTRSLVLCSVRFREISGLLESNANQFHSWSCSVPDTGSGDEGYFQLT